MTVKSGQIWRGLWLSTEPANGTLLAPGGAGGRGALYVNGVLNAAVVTIAGDNPYSWSVTLPTLSAGDRVSMLITADYVEGERGWVVAEESVDTILPSELAAAVWDRLTTGLTTVGSVGAYLLSKLGLLVSGSVALSSPLAEDGTTIRLYEGDDYQVADGRQIDFTVSTTATLAGASVAIVLEGVNTYEGSVVDETTVRWVLTDTETSLIPTGETLRYSVRATLVSENVVTLGRGVLRSLAAYEE